MIHLLLTIKINDFKSTSSIFLQGKRQCNTDCVKDGQRPSCDVLFKQLWNVIVASDLWNGKALQLYWIITNFTSSLFKKNKEIYFWIPFCNELPLDVASYTLLPFDWLKNMLRFNLLKHSVTKAPWSSKCTFLNTFQQNFLSRTCFFRESHLFL